MATGSRRWREPAGKHQGIPQNPAPGEAFAWIPAPSPAPRPKPTVVRMGRAARSAGFRWRRQLAPVWAVGAAWTAGAGSWKAGAGEPAAIVASLTVAAWCLWLWLLSTRGSRRLRRRAARGYLAFCGLATAGITVAAATAGPSSHAAGLALAAGTAAAFPWWWRNRTLFDAAPAPEDAIPDMDAPLPEDEAVQIWREFVACTGGPIPGAVLDGFRPVPGGITSDVTLRRGQVPASVALGHGERVASAYQESPQSVVLEKHPTGRADKLRFTLFAENPLYFPQAWEGPSLNKATGEIRIGMYATGGYATFRPWAPQGNGHPGGALHSLIAGTTGSGKSQFLLQLALEYLASGVVVLWAADQQYGASMPEILEHAHRPARSVAETVEMLHAAERILEARSRWMAANGVRTMMPTAGQPMYRLIIDEAHLVLTDPVWGKEAVRALEHLTQMGRKCCIGVDLLTQVPDLAQLGNSEVLRSMLQSGNIVCFRTAGKMSADRAFQGMLPVDPSLIPQVFPNGSGSAGTCYMATALSRQAPARTWLMADSDEEAARMTVHFARFAVAPDALSDAAARGGDGASAGTVTAAPGSPAAGMAPVTVVQAPAPGARPASFSAEDVVLETLRRAGRPLKASEVWDASGWAVNEWGMAERYSSRTIGLALSKLRPAGRVCQDGERAPYYLPGPGNVPDGTETGTPVLAGGLGEGTR